MTCIIAVEHGGKVYMGGDSSMLCGLSVEGKEKKVFFLGDFIIGSTGSHRFSQLIEFGIALPEKVEGENDLRYIVSRLIPAIRECAKQNGYTKIENGVERVDDILLLGYHGKIYKVHADFAVTVAFRGYAAIGCGEDFALGAISAFRGSSMFDPGAVEGMILAALKISGEFSAGVLPDYYVLSN